MTAAQRKARERRIQGAMAELIRDPRFGAFIDMIRDCKDRAVDDACLDSVMSSQRLSMVAMGEVRAYSDIIRIFDECVNSAEQQAALREEEAT
jgi:hypothetical protein